MKKDPKCKRCGKCCYVIDKNQVWHPCKYLEQWQGRTHCEHYYTRIGRQLGNFQICLWESPWNIPGCPFNKDNKQDHPYWIKQEILK